MPNYPTNKKIHGQKSNLFEKKIVETVAKKLYKSNTRILKDTNKLSIVKLKK